MKKHKFQLFPHRSREAGACRRPGVLFLFTTLIAGSQATAQITADINVQLRPIIEHIDLVTDINVVGKTMYVCTQPGQIYRKNLSANTAAEVFLDLSWEVGGLGSPLPGLPGLGFPD